MKEIFKRVPIPEFEEVYEVSNLGRVRRVGSGLFLKGTETRYGYIRVKLSNRGRRKMINLHNIVAQAFLENPKNLDTVDHISMNKRDNSVHNLRWMDRSENSKLGNDYQNVQGRNNPNYGNRWTEEMKKSLSKKVSGEVRSGENNANYGKRWPKLKREIQSKKLAELGISQGMSNPKAKLDDLSVREIRKRAERESVSVLSIDYGVSKNAIRDTIKRKTWAHIK